MSKNLNSELKKKESYICDPLKMEESYHTSNIGVTENNGVALLKSQTKETQELA
jgi:hypothetical protein